MGQAYTRCVCVCCGDASVHMFALALVGRGVSARDASATGQSIGTQRGKILLVSLLFVRGFGHIPVLRHRGSRVTMPCPRDILQSACGFRVC